MMRGSARLTDSDLWANPLPMPADYSAFRENSGGP